MAGGKPIAPHKEGTGKGWYLSSMPTRYYALSAYSFKSIPHFGRVYNLLSPGMNPSCREMEPVEPHPTVIKQKIQDLNPDLACPLSHIILGSRFYWFDIGGQQKFSGAHRGHQSVGTLL